MSFKNDLNKLFSASVLTTVTLCNCPTKKHEITSFMTRSSFIRTIFRLIKSTLLLIMKCCHRMLSTRCCHRVIIFHKKGQEVLKTGLFSKVITYQRHRLFKRYTYFTFKLIYVKVVSGRKN